MTTAKCLMIFRIILNKSPNHIWLMLINRIIIISKKKKDIQFRFLKWYNFYLEKETLFLRHIKQEVNITIKMEDFFMQKYPFILARNFSFISSKILYKDFLMKPRVRRFFSKMFEDFLQNT